MSSTVKIPCRMVVAMSMASFHKSGCVVRYDGEMGHGVKETLDDYAGSVDDLFYDGAKIPTESGIYNFIGFAKVCMIGGSDEPIVFEGEFLKI